MTYNQYNGKKPMLRSISILLFLSFVTEIFTNPRGTHSNENLPLFLQKLELRRQAGQEDFNPFKFAFARVQNHLIDEEESDLRILTRLSEPEILMFLDWWERKYYLRPADLEALYGENFVNEQINPGKFWRMASNRLRNQLRLGWFRKFHHYVFPEYRLFLKDLGYRSTTIHRP